MGLLLDPSFALATFSVFNDQWAYNLRRTAGGADMAKTKQFTIAVDNQPGAVAGIAKTLGDAKVNILSLLGTAQGTAGAGQIHLEEAPPPQENPVPPPLPCQAKPPGN